MTFPYPADGTQEIVRIARASTEPHPVDHGKLYVVPDGAGHKVIDLTGDQYRDQPRRKRATVTVEDVASFAHYYSKHADDMSDVYADLNQGTITAILDAHTSDDGARWGLHRLTLQLHQTEPWRAWIGNHGQMLAQADFAEFIEEHAIDVATGQGEGIHAGDLIDLAQHFHTNTTVEFSSGTRLASGETQLHYSESIDGRPGGRGGTVEVPSQFVLTLRPFDDAEDRHVIARFRYRITNRQLRLGYRLDQPERIMREAVSEVVDKARQECGDITIMRGTYSGYASTAP